jgi:hypothetical protein
MPKILDGMEILPKLMHLKPMTPKKYACLRATMWNAGTMGAKGLADNALKERFAS